MNTPAFAVRYVEAAEQLRDVWAFAETVLDLPKSPRRIEYYLERLGRESQLMLFAEHDGNVCGCALASVDGGHVLIGEMAVAAEWRRKGIGAAMMKELEKQARLMGYGTLLLGAREEAEPFYLSCGFQPNLFIQLPQPGCLEQLKSMNPDYEIVWSAQDTEWSKLMLRTPRIDKPLQRRYEQAFPNCHTQYVFTKKI